MRWVDRLLEVVLGGGTSKAARLRGWHRRILLAEASPRRRVSLLKRGIMWPVKAAQLATEASRSYGSLVREKYGPSTLRQWVDQWRLAVSTGMPPEEYYSLRLFMPDRQAVAGQFMLSGDMHVLFMALAKRQGAEEAAALDDKESFHAWCKSKGLPSPRTFRTFERGHCNPIDLPLDATLPPVDLFSKPKDYRWGIGTARWSWVAEQTYRGEDGRLISEEGMMEELIRQSSERPIILQERLANHPEVSGLSGGALCTVRVVTSRATGGRARVVAAAFAMPVGSAPASNFHYGSVVSGIDIRTGRLGPGVVSDTARCTVSFDRHPDTGNVFLEERLPLWEDVVELVEKAHGEVCSVSSLGWDVALSDSGPVLVEVNVSWGLDIVQMPSGYPIVETEFYDHIISELRGLPTS